MSRSPHWLRSSTRYRPRAADKGSRGPPPKYAAPCSCPRAVRSASTYPASARTTTSLFTVVPLEAREHLRALEPNRLQAVGIEPQGLQKGRGNLRGLHGSREGPRRDPRAGQQQHHVDVIVREPAVLGLLRCA